MSIYSEGLKINGEKYEVIPPSPTEAQRGGIKAKNKESTDTVEVKLGEDGKLYVAAYPTILPASDVYEWAKQAKKPSYTASEVGADPAGSAEAAQSNAIAHADGVIGDVANELKSHADNSTIHVTSGDKANWGAAYSHSTTAHAPSTAEKNVIIGIQKNGTDLTVNSSTRKVNITVPTTAAEVNADPAGTASSAVSSHNTSTSAHNDIRALISTLTTRLNTLADSDDTTLDQMSEVVAYIKENKSLIESVTTNKVNVSDIVNNLTTNVSNKPLSAAQGVALKGLIDALQAVVDGKANKSHSHAIADITNLQTTLDGKAASSHGTHVTYGTTNPLVAGTASVGSSAGLARIDHVHPAQTNISGNAASATTAATASKVASSLAIKLNGGTTEGTNLFTFNGSAAKTVNITASAIGAAATSHGNHVPATQTANNATFLRNDNTWATVTPANIGAAALSHNHDASNITSGTLSIDRLPTVTVAKGGTGLTTLTSGQVLVGNGTSAVTFRAIDTTSGGTASSTSLITSGAVNAGLATKAASSHTHNYAGSSSAGGAATKAITIHAVESYSGGNFGIPLYINNTSGYQDLFSCSGFRFLRTVGTSSVQGSAVLTLGNSTVSGTAGNEQGIIRLYNSSSGYTDITTATSTTNFTCTLPAKGGTLALDTVASQSSNGLMSAADKKKLDGIATGANAYSLPTASSSTLGGVKTTSTVTSASGLTACPIISGVPYYKDIDTTIIEDETYPGCYYRMVDGQQEWLIAPMVLGEGFRTTERYNNKPVWTCRKNFGALVDSATATVSTLLGATAIVRACGWVTNGDGATYTTPCRWNSGYIFMWASTGAIQFKCEANASDCTAVVQLWYTRD